MSQIAAAHGKLRPRLGVVVTTWSHEDGHAHAQGLVKRFPEHAPAEEVEVVPCPTLLEWESDIPGIVSHFEDKAIDALCLIPGNFTLDHVMPLMAQAMGLPTILWGLPGREAWGALVAIQQTLFPFKELGLSYRFFVGEVGEARVWHQALPFLRAAALKRQLRGLRVGLMGWRAQGMSDVVFDELALRETFGVQVVNVGLTRYTRALEAIPGKEVELTWGEMRSGFDTADTPEEVTFHGVRSYLAMKQLTEEEKLDAVTVECFHDHLGGPCLGCSIFNDQGVAAACESDVPGAVLMAAMQMLTGEPTFHTDFITAELEQNAVVVGHCGNIPRHLAADPDVLKLEPIRAATGPSTFGPTVVASMKPGPVTAVNLVGRRGTMRVAALEGEGVPYELEFPGSWGKVVFPFDLAEALERLGNAGYGHHFVISRGHIGRELAEWCALLEIDYLQPAG